jgi:hypothetical protein
MAESMDKERARTKTFEELISVCVEARRITIATQRNDRDGHHCIISGQHRLLPFFAPVSHTFTDPENVWTCSVVRRHTHRQTVSAHTVSQEKSCYALVHHTHTPFLRISRATQ